MQYRRVAWLLYRKEFVHSLIIWLSLVLWFLIFSNSLFDHPKRGLDRIISSHSFWFLYDPPKQSENITIVAIDEASRRNLNLKWPWKRTVTAGLIRNITAHSPAVIGLDIVFSGSADEEGDRELVAALASHPKTVLGYIHGRDSDEKPLQEFVDAAASIGFVNKPSKEMIVDETKTFHSEDPGGTKYSLDVEILRHYLGIDGMALRVNRAGIFHNENLIIPSPGGVATINYLVHPSDFVLVTASAVLKNEVPPEAFKNKIVLVGATDPIIHDVFMTPLGPFPGVAIIGNSLVMFLSNRFLYDPPPWAQVSIALLSGFVILLISNKLPLLPTTILSILIAAGTYASFLLLRGKDIRLPYLLIFFSQAASYAAVNLYRHVNLIYNSSRAKNLAIRDPLTGFYTLRFFTLRCHEQLRAKGNVNVIAIRIRNYSNLASELNYEQIRMLTKLIAEQLKGQVSRRFRQPAFSRSSYDTFYALIRTAGKEEIEAFFRDFLHKMNETEFSLPDKNLRIPLCAFSVHRSSGNPSRTGNLMEQIEGMIDEDDETHMLVSRDSEGAGGSKGEERRQDFNDDFVTYDIEERNMDLEKSLKEVLEANKKLDRLNWGTLTALARAVDAKSPWTAGHSERVTRIALKIGGVLGLSQNRLDALQQASLLHDIGKIAIPGAILDKPGRLTEEEYRIIREHPDRGVSIIEPIDSYSGIIPYIRHHHELFSGGGYPNGLAGEAIPLEARILALADVFDALISDRPYRAGLPFGKVVEIIRKEAGMQFDPTVVRAFFEVLNREGHAVMEHPVAACVTSRS
jgi:response regulator RpfG family c-di-GMP phosphodiesterase/CHASE2 domain-containing sensor protein